MELLCVHLGEERLIRLDQNTRKLVHQELEKANARFAAIGRLSLVVALLALGIASLLFVSSHNPPIFLPLAPGVTPVALR
jgi:hypothetical protein